jgi:lipid-binding SYLF domain-containing protein
MASMMRRAFGGLVAGCLLLVLSGPVLTAAETSRQERLVEQARLVLDDFLDDPEYERMRVYVQNAYAVMIIPDMLEGGFLIGAQHGVGVMLVRNPQTGGWGQPAFYDLFGGSLGLQFGGKSSDVVFTIMNQGAVKKLVTSGIKLGADAEVALGRRGAGVGAATTTRFGEDLYVFAKSQGLFGGFAVDGSYLAAKDNWNRAYYGRAVRPEEVLNDYTIIAGTEVSALHETLTRF